MADVECVVVGGGIAGLLAALRLALAGARVLLLERDQLGSGATIGNQGTIHSGAFYAQLHPEITSACQQAQRAYRAAFPDAVLPMRRSWYLASPQRITALQPLWDAQSIGYQPIDQAATQSLLRPEAAVGLACVAIQDTLVASRQLTVNLAQRCLDAGVTIEIATPVRELLLHDGRAAGVTLGASQRVTAELVVVCCGVGTHPLMQRIGANLHQRLKSRLDLMVAFPNMRLERAVFCLDYGGLTLAPTTAGLVLASRYGGTQPWIKRPGRWPVPVQAALELREQLARTVTNGLLDLGAGRAYVCSKTEVAAGASDPWGVEPNYAVIDHRTEDGLGGLWTVLPGKMTLALHASHTLAARITGSVPPFDLPPPPSIIHHQTPALVAAEPWLAPDQTPRRRQHIPRRDRRQPTTKGDPAAR
jgi:glycine/D-amino acid oxidase-like deaminating enzyme